MIINYQHFVPKGTKINLAKYGLARVFWNRLFRQPQGMKAKDRIGKTPIASILSFQLRIQGLFAGALPRNAVYLYLIKAMPTGQKSLLGF